MCVVIERKCGVDCIPAKMKGPVVVHRPNAMQELADNLVSRNVHEAIFQRNLTLFDALVAASPSQIIPKI